MSDQCDKCKINTYGYTDGRHHIFICFKCGKYDGMSGGDTSFINVINEEPLMLLMMIKQKILVPIS